MNAQFLKSTQGAGVPMMAGMMTGPMPQPAGPRIGGFSPDEGDEDSPYLKMTPMELDLQLQCAELIFRSILEGKRLAVHPSEDLEEWEQDVLGEAWVQRNKKQRAMVRKATEASGENTPEWMEALSDMGDLAWEVFESTNTGELLRKKKDVDRSEVLELLKDILPKVRVSHYARCGAGERLYGLRACIGILRLFSDDPEVLEACCDVLKWVVHEVEYNRNGLTELSMPIPPEDRRADQPEKGWAFLRAALDAYMVQLGEQHWGWRPDDSNHRDASDSESSSEESVVSDAANDDIDRTPRRSVAIKIAEVILAVRQAPALVVQLKLLGESKNDSMCLERIELSDMMPSVIAKTEEVIAAHPDEAQILSEFLEVLRLSTPRVHEVVEAEEGGPSSSSSGKKDEAGVIKGMLGGMRGLLGKGSST